MARKPRFYLLTATAEQDFREARRWFLSRWGKKLTQQYFTDFHESAKAIAQNHQRFAFMEHLADHVELKIHPVREHYLL